MDKSPSASLNKRNTPLLLAVVSSDYKFLWIDVSGKRSSSDAHIYNESEFKEGLQRQ